MQADYTLLRQAGDWLRQLVAILDPDGQPQRTGAQVRSEFEAYLAQIEQDSAGTPRLHEFSAAIAKVSRSYAPGLFHTYDVPGLPRTNNDRESEFRTLNRRLLRTTGQKGLTRRILQHAALGNSCRIPAPWRIPPRRSQASQHTTCAKNNSVSVSIAPASDCIPVPPNRPRPNSLNSSSDGQHSQLGTAYSDFCGIAFFPFLKLGCFRTIREMFQP